VLSGIAISPDGDYAYVGTPYPHTIWVIDTETNQVADSIELVHPAGNNALV